jgi:hypothetical protein
MHNEPSSLVGRAFTVYFFQVSDELMFGCDDQVFNLNFSDVSKASLDKVGVLFPENFDY